MPRRTKKIPKQMSSLSYGSEESSSDGGSGHRLGGNFPRAQGMANGDRESLHMVRGVGDGTDSSSGEEGGNNHIPAQERSWISPKSDGASWIARPYKREALDKAIKSTIPGTERRDAVLANLKSMGVTAFIIDSRHATTTVDVMEHVHRVIGFVSKENRNFDPVFQRCLLFQDKEGLLYNIVVPPHIAGEADNWHQKLDSFSAFQATLGLMILIRSFPCITEDHMDERLKPAVLAIILGLVLYEELSLSYLNSTMMVRACPSISAYSITNKTSCDWLRKLIVLCVALSAAATGKAQLALFAIGISLACIVLLANLGSRVWYFFNWQPLTYDGPLASLYAYIAAVATGIVVPFMGHRLASVGGKPAIESIMRSVIGLTFMFIVSDLNGFQQFLTVGSAECSQKGVNIFVGIWLPLTLVISVWMVAKVKSDNTYPDEEPLLEEDRYSPVGYKVPSLPDYPIDPTLAEKSLPYLSLRAEIVISILLAGIASGGVLSLILTDWEDSIEQPLQTILF